MATNKVQADLELQLRLDPASLSAVAQQLERELNRVLGRVASGARAGNPSAPGGVSAGQGDDRVAGVDKLTDSVADSLSKGIAKALPSLTQSIGKAIADAFGGSNVLGSFRNPGAVGALGGAFGINGGPLGQLVTSTLLQSITASRARGGGGGGGYGGSETLLGGELLGTQFLSGLKTPPPFLGPRQAFQAHFQAGADRLAAFTKAMNAKNDPAFRGPPTSLIDRLRGAGGRALSSISQGFETALEQSGGFGGLAKSLGKIPTAVGGVVIAFEALKALVEKLLGPLFRAIEAGAKLYEQSRMLGLSTTSSARLFESLGAVGIDPGMALRLSAYGQFRPGMTATEFGGETLSAGMRVGMSQLEIQQLRNMLPQLERATKDLTVATEATGTSAKSNYDTFYQWYLFKEDFKAFWAQFGELVAPILQSSLSGGGAVVESAARQLNILNNVGEYAVAGLNGYLALNYPGAHLGVSSPETQSAKLQPYLRESHFSGLERMGLVIGGHQDRLLDYARQTAHNTAVIAQKIVIFSGSGQHGNQFGGGPIFIAQPSGFNLP